MGKYTGTVRGYTVVITTNGTRNAHGQEIPVSAHVLTSATTDYPHQLAGEVLDALDSVCEKFDVVASFMGYEVEFHTTSINYIFN